MTDRFKFRVWEKQNNTYSAVPYGNYALSDDGELFWLESHCDCSELNTEVFIVEQCTGLKDKNGKLIFEGDIVSCMMNCPRRGVVEFYRNAFCLNENGSYSEDIIFSEKCCEVIGNIHKNKDLIEREE